MTATKKVALYARVSTALQSTGLETQVRILRQYLEQNDIKDYQIFMDENVSGTKNSRPGLDQMMAAVRNGDISTVVVSSVIRLISFYFLQSGFTLFSSGLVEINTVR